MLKFKFLYHYLRISLHIYVIMPNLILIKDISFKYIPTFDKLNLNNIELSIKDKIEIIYFEKTSDLILLLQQMFGKGVNEVTNCIYDEKYVIQSIYRDICDAPIYEKMVMIKREINENDSYTFGEFNDKTDPYKYVDITLSDVVNIIRKKYINDAVYINCNGTIDTIEFIDITESDNNGLLYIKHNGNVKKIKYINSVNISHKLSKDCELIEEQLQEELKNALTKHDSDYIYMKKDFGLGSFNYFCQAVGFVKNDIVSDLMSSPTNEEVISGDVIICLENTLNDDTRILSMNSEMFNKLKTFIKKLNSKYKPKNKHICNLYYELA